MSKVNGIRSRITLGVILILILTLSPVAFFLVKDARDLCIKRIDEKGFWATSHVASLVRDAPSANEHKLIKGFAESVCQDPEIAYCNVYGPNGDPIVESGSKFLPAGSSAKKFEKRIVDNENFLGTIILGVRTDAIRAMTKITLVEISIMALCIVLTVAIFIRFFLDRFFVLPVVRISQQAVDIGRKKFPDRFDSKRLDEIGDLERAINFASRQINRLYSELENKVEERTNNLKLSNLQLRDEIEERARIQAHLAATLEELSFANQRLVKARDKAELTNRFKNQFLAMMSHEIRTPMNTILGMAELLDETGLNREQEGYIDSCRESAEHLLQIIDDILIMVNIETSQVEFLSKPFHPVAELNKICEKICSSASNKRIELQFNFSPDVPDEVLGDSERVCKVVKSVISNAIKFTSEGTVHVKLDVEKTFGERVHLLFSVTDTGVGIPEDKHSLIFDCFTQADNSSSREFGGTGLGLAIASRLVKLMNGKIWFDSKVNIGSTFYISLPFKTSYLQPLVS